MNPPDLQFWGRVFGVLALEIDYLAPAYAAAGEDAAVADSLAWLRKQLA